MVSYTLRVEKMETFGKVKFCRDNLIFFGNVISMIEVRMHLENIKESCLNFLLQKTLQTQGVFMG